MLKPLKTQPIFKDYIWGGNKLNEKYGKKSGTERTAESWELSVHPDGECVLDNGKTLKSYIAENPSVLGTNRKSDELPVLIKLIDACDRLSIQVYPNDEQAQKWENQNGKTEMWYVVEADKGAEIVYGVKENTDRETIKKAIENNTVMDLLDSVKSKKGDVFFVEAGTIHAIGKGNLIAEIQQNSNVTYRLYDYDRRDKNGALRELHVEKGVKALNANVIQKRETPMASDGTRLIGSCEYFQVKELILKGKKELEARKGSYQALTCVRGKASIESTNSTVELCCGDTVFVPAGMGKYELSGNAAILITENPPHYYVGIDLGGTNIVAAVVDEYGTVYGRAARKTNSPRPYEEIFDDMIFCAREAARLSGISFEDIENVGVGCPGSLNRKTGYIEFSNNLYIKNAPLADYLTKELGKKIYIENDANAAAWGEFLAGSGKNCQNMIMITLGTGIGGGIIMDGKLVRGAYDNGAEIGHMTLVMDGLKCNCGKNGCFELYASATALIRQTKEAMKNNPDSLLWKTAGGKLSNVNGKTVFDTKDKVAKDVIDTYLGYLAEGVVSVINLLQPEIVCIGGGVSNAGNRIVKPINKLIRKKSYARFGEKQTVATIAELNNDAGLIGAALLWKAQ